MTSFRPRRRSLLHLCWLLIATLFVAHVTGMGVALATAAPADESGAKAPFEGEAKRLFEDGVSAYDAGNYDLAIVRFRAAYARTQAPALLFNIAQVLRRKGDCLAALEAYRNFKTLSPDKAKALDVDMRIREMKTSCPTDADPARPDPQPSAKKTDVALSIPPFASAPSPVLAALPAPESRTPPRTWRTNSGWAFIGLAVGGAAMGAYNLYAYDQSSQQLSRLSASGMPWNAYASELEHQSTEQRDISRISFIAAGTTLAIGLGLLVWEHWRLEQKARP